MSEYRRVFSGRLEHAPPRGGSLISPEVTRYGLRRVRCSGCPERPHCSNSVERHRVQKVNHCWQYIDAEAKAGRRRYRQSKRPAGQPKFRSVWHGGEGLSQGSVPSSLGRGSIEEAGV